MLFYTGIARTAADVAKSYVARIESRRRQLRIMKELVDESIDVLASGDEHPRLRRPAARSLAGQAQPEQQVSNAEVDDLYERARAAGAIGGKLTGAGGGGFLLLFAPPDRHADILESLGRIHVPFEFETAGSQIIFYEPGIDYLEAEKARDRTAFAFSELQCPPDAARRRRENRISRIFVAGGDTLLGRAHCSTTSDRRGSCNLVGVGA